MSAPRQGGSLRDTSIVVVVVQTDEVYIVSSLSTRNDTQVIYIDPTTGLLTYYGKLGQDLFNSEEQALNYITDGSRFSAKSTTYARAILGYSALGSYGLLLVATRLSASVPELPGGGCIYTVTESQWIKIPLQNPQLQGKGELKNIQELADFDINGKYYFCETRDITRPFPSNRTFQDPDSEFVWNGWFSKPFIDIGLPQHCVVLLQGFAECRSFSGTGQHEGIVSLIARRSRLHPGTRYLARGINACSSTGNEVECEQLVWVPQRAGQAVPFSSYIWRRGTIPIWWGAELKFASEAEIYVSSQDPYKGSLAYYQRLRRRYGIPSSEISTAKRKNTPTVITCVNLLRSSEGKAENILVEHFNESLKHVKSTGRLPSTKLDIINYDWHATVKLRGEQETIEGLWKLLKVPTTTIGFCEGSYSTSTKQLKEYNGLVVSSEDFVGGFCIRSVQNGVIRFNCADSLDRTNAASYFGALQVFVEQCSRLGISLDNDSMFGFSSSNRYLESGNYQGSSGPLPPGWEERCDSVTGKRYYIDHNTRRTSWEHPCQGQSWRRFDMSFDRFKSSTALAPVNQLADLFLLAGDIHATLYTGSKAMHSQILKIFSDGSGSGGKFSKFLAAQNVTITVKRHYQNVLVDSSRQKQFEMFLGLRLFKHLPSIPIHPLKVVSRPSGCFLKPVPAILPVAGNGANLLSFKKDVVWVCPPAADVVELFIYLAEPCHVSQLLLTVSHGADDSYYPSTVDVRTGCSLDGLKLILEGASIPHCANGTNLLIPLTGKVDPEDLAVTGKSSLSHAQGSVDLPLLYDFEELEEELNFLTRIVALTFYPSEPGNKPTTLGEIEVLGVSLPWMRIFNDSVIHSKYMKLLEERMKQSDTSHIGPEVNDPTNPFLCGDDDDKLSSMNGHGSLISQSSSVSSYFDLLTGEFVVTSQPEVSRAENKIESSSMDLNLDFLDFSASSFPASTIPDSSDISRHLKDDGVQSRGKEKYVNLLTSLIKSNKGKPIDFMQAMKLEIERFRLNMSAAERDRALLSDGTVPAKLDPNRLVGDGDGLLMLCNDADSLALLGQSAFEDKINASVGLEAVDDVIDFWNINEIGDACLGAQCEVRAEAQPTGASSKTSASGNFPLFFICSSCERKVCKVCAAGKGASLLSNNKYKDSKNSSVTSSQTGSFRGGCIEGTYSSSNAVSEEVICKRCIDSDILKALYVDYVRVLGTLRKNCRVDDAACRALLQVIGPEINMDANAWQRIEACKRQLMNLLNGYESLAEYPYASLLHEVETARGSEPLSSLLLPSGMGKHNSYWKASPSLSTVDFSVVLGGLSDVSGAIIIVSSCGYSLYDCPTVQIWASNTIHREERTYIGKWDIKSLLSSSPQLSGPDKSSSGYEIPRHVRFQFQNTIRCRIIWMTLTLPSQNANTIKLEDEYNLLSLDESSTSRPKAADSFGRVPNNDRCIHAKRLIVFGKSVRNGIVDNSIDSPDMIKMKRILERPLQFTRIRVPIEGEMLEYNDLILKQYLSPMGPGLAGFRLDAFNVIKPLVTHSPAFVSNDAWKCSLVSFDERNISPAILYIQVFVGQGPTNLILVGQYRLPEVKAGTALYFDFPQAIQAECIVFKLVGGVTAFEDDITEQGYKSSRNLPVASGLSLANRIKLYYYADSYELGKVASLSAI